MISERQAAQEFHALWNEVLPLLTPHFVRLFNEGFRKPLLDANGLLAPIITPAPDSDPALVAELAFHLARLAHSRGEPTVDVVRDEGLIQEAEQLAISLMSEYESGAATRRNAVGEGEREEALRLLGNYEIFLSGYADREVEFSPLVRGSGFVDACAGDISVGESLFEVKTVKRNIAGKDIRQLMVYLALQAATGNRRWSDAGFFNPRQACVYLFSVDRVVPLMSGGRLAAEVFEEMVGAFAMRDIQVDSPF